MIALPDLTLLDGAVGAELARRGVPTPLPLWSASALLEAPDVVTQIHRDYLEAGARILTANTFRTHARSLAQGGLGHRADELNERAIECATRAVEATGIAAQIVGSVAPLEDCYEPSKAPEESRCLEEQAQQVASLMRAGADGVLVETMGTIREASAAARAASELAPGRWGLSLCMRSDGDAGCLLSGEPLDDLLSQLGASLGEGLSGPFAFGVNCVPAPRMEAEVLFLRAAVAPEIPICAYANVGEPDPATGWRATDAEDPSRYAEYAMRWVRAGAALVGGCCGTSPETIRAVARVVQEC